jgi:hypothetical protein
VPHLVPPSPTNERISSLMVVIIRNDVSTCADLSHFLFEFSNHVTQNIVTVRSVTTLAFHEQLRFRKSTQNPSCANRKLESWRGSCATRFFGSFSWKGNGVIKRPNLSNVIRERGKPIEPSPPKKGGSAEWAAECITCKIIVIYLLLCAARTGLL